MSGGFYSRSEIEQIVQNLETPNISPYRVPGRGKVFFRDPSIGSDGNDGTDPNKPLATLAAAYNKCVDKRGDYIIVLGPRHVNGVDIVTPTLVVAKANIHLIGIGNGSQDSDNHLNGGSLPSIELAEGGDQFELAGFSLGNDGSVAAIHRTHYIARFHLHHCMVGYYGFGATNGIGHTGAGQLSNCLIDNNFFGPSLSAIDIDTYITSGVISNNTFFSPQTRCMCGAESMLRVEIFGNKFFSPQADALAAGWAVYLDANAYLCWVFHNWAASSGSKHDADAANLSNNPYRDLSSATPDLHTLKNGWADNYDSLALSDGPDVT